MKDKKVLIISTLLLIICLTCIFNVFAHSGRTDSSGGHRDNSNQSGLGSYHYHCGGYPAHLHTNGVCPYTNGGYSSKETFEELRKRYGLNEKISPTDQAYTNGYDDGYEKGAELENQTSRLSRLADERAKKIDEKYGKDAYGGTAWLKQKREEAKNSKKETSTEEANGYNERYDEYLEQYEENEKLKAENSKLEDTITIGFIVSCIIILLLGYKAFKKK